MQKVIATIILFAVFIAYSCWVYDPGTASAAQMSRQAIKGKGIWHSRNCQNCHQVFGLGGFMGPDLTMVTKDKTRGTLYARAMLMNGGAVMPNFHFTDGEVDELVAYLEYIGTTASSKILYP